MATACVLISQTDRDKISKDLCERRRAGTAILPESEREIGVWKFEKRKLDILWVTMQRASPVRCPTNGGEWLQRLSDWYTCTVFPSMKIQMHYTLLVKLLTAGWKEAGHAMGETHDCVDHLHWQWESAVQGELATPDGRKTGKIHLWKKKKRSRRPMYRLSPAVTRVRYPGLGPLLCFFPSWHSLLLCC